MAEGKALTPLQLQSAMLAAQGFGPRESAKMLGCHEKTIVHYGREDWWVAERDKWIELGLSKLDTAITAQRARILALHDQLMDGLLEAMQAVDPVLGLPDWDTRLEAYKIIATHPGIRKLLGAETTSGSGEAASASAVTVVQLHIPADRVPEKQQADFEIIDHHDIAGELGPGE